MAGEGDADLGFAADDGFAGDVVGHAVEGAGVRERPGCIFIGRWGRRRRR